MGKTIKAAFILGIVIMVTAYIIITISLNHQFTEKKIQLEEQLAAVNTKKENLDKQLTNLKSVVTTLRSELNAKLISEGKKPVSSPAATTVIPDPVPAPTPKPPKVTRAS